MAARTATLLQGNALSVLRTLPPGAFQCCVTSPPYYGLRDYGTGTWTGGDPDCEHRGDCQCGAHRVDLQIGLEATPELYVERLVEVFEQVRRVLRDDGTLWLNMGDSYANDGKWGGSSGGKKHAQGLHGESGVGRGKRDTGLKPKDLLGMPWRVAFALQAAGWWLRSEVIWDKVNPMPESVKDRPTKAHETIFLLAKSERYFYDAEAVREPDVGADHRRSVLHKPEPSGGIHPPNRGIRKATGRNGEGRNLRSVWTFTTRPYSGAHFATFPPEMAERCIRAGSREGDAILDPFGGAGTTAMVALRLGRSATSIELNPAYVEMQERRIRGDAPLLNEVSRGR